MIKKQGLMIWIKIDETAYYVILGHGKVFVREQASPFQQYEVPSGKRCTCHEWERRGACQHGDALAFIGERIRECLKGGATHVSETGPPESESLRELGSRGKLAPGEAPTGWE